MASSFTPAVRRVTHRYKFHGTTETASGEEKIQRMIMEGGPVETAFTVFSDFEDYAGGLDLCINQIVEARLRHC